MCAGVKQNQRSAILVPHQKRGSPEPEVGPWQQVPSVCVALRSGLLDTHMGGLSPAGGVQAL